MLRVISFLVFVFSIASQLPAQTQQTGPGSTPPTAKSPDENSQVSQILRLSQQGRYDEAIAQLQSLSAVTPKPAGLSHAFGVVYYQKGDYLKAADYFKQATTEDANDKEAVELLGLSFYRAGRPTEAIPYLETVQAWYPKANVDASYVLGIAYIYIKAYPTPANRSPKCSTCPQIQPPASFLRPACF